jgi:hypothetical protein
MRMPPLCNAFTRRVGQPKPRPVSDLHSTFGTTAKWSDLPVTPTPPFPHEYPSAYVTTAVPGPKSLVLKREMDAVQQTG